MSAIVDNDIKQAICGCLGGKLGKKRGVCLVTDKHMGVGGFVLVLLRALAVVLDKIEIYAGQVFEPGVVRRSGAIVLYNGY